LALDHARGALVLAIRGTFHILSLSLSLPLFSSQPLSPLFTSPFTFLLYLPSHTLLPYPFLSCYPFSSVFSLDHFLIIFISQGLPNRFGRRCSRIPRRMGAQRLRKSNRAKIRTSRSDDYRIPAPPSALRTCSLWAQHGCRYWRHFYPYVSQR
jgi:hypothetical protein